MQAEYDALSAEHDGLDTLSDEIEARLSALEDRLAAFESTPPRFESEEMAIAGAFISIDPQGRLQVERGYVRPEDELPVPVPTAEAGTGAGFDPQDPMVDPAVAALSDGTATLSDGFYKQLQQHSVPLEEAAVRAVANNSMALDIYAWLAYRLHSLIAVTSAGVVRRPMNIFGARHHASS